MSKNSRTQQKTREKPQTQSIAPAKNGIFAGYPEWRLIAIFCIAAMLRIFIFNAAFPFFNNVDEQFHLDTIVKYAHGYTPLPGTNSFDYESSRLIAACSTPEYFHAAAQFPNGNVPLPVYKLPPRDAAGAIDQGTAIWLSRQSNESFSPPLYYYLEGIWYNIGKALGFATLGLLYWLKFSNVLLYALLIVTAYLLCKHMFGNRPHLVIGVPLLLVFFPQDLFYTLNSDIPSALFFALSMLTLWLLYERKRGIGFYLLAGVVTGLGFLIKLTDAFLAVPLLFVCALLLIRAVREKRLASEISRILPLLALSALPGALWMAWNLHAFGDLTATAPKVAMLTWTKKPLLAMFDHPIFSPQGAWFFVAELLRTFWRGELVWGLKRLSWSATDAFYVFSSVALLLIATVNALLRRKADPANLFLTVMNVCCIGAGLGVLAWLSIRFDFGSGWYPSRSNPYFTSGRLISGATVPFLCLYVEGLAVLLGKLSRKINPVLVIAVLGIAILLCEFAIKAPVFASQYNLFHG